LPFKKGASGNPSGWPKGKPRTLTQTVRALVNGRGGAIVEKIIESAEAGDVEARRQFLRYLLPHPKLVLTPVDLEPAKDAAEAQAQIGMLTRMAARGELDLDSLHALSRALAMAIDTRLAELEERLGEQEAGEPDDG
jgi:Family of unknown function (DUF5681)